MDYKSKLDKVLKHRFLVTPTGYPAQNGFLDYGVVLTRMKLEILNEFRKIFVDENTYEIEASAVLPYDVLKNSGHIDKFCDVVLSDGEKIYRADHYIEEYVGEIHNLPINLLEDYDSIIEKVKICKKKIIDNKKIKFKTKNGDKYMFEKFTKKEVDEILNEFETKEKKLADCTKLEYDFIVILNNLYSEDNKPFLPSKDLNLIFKLNDSQFLRPEIAQSQFTNFRKLFNENNERLPFSSLSIGRSYRNEISARGGMLRTKEFEQAEIEYFCENGEHIGFEEIKNIKIKILPNDVTESFEITLGEAYEKKIISSQAICYFIGRSYEFLLTIGFKPASIRYRQHMVNEMAHYAADCWDVEIKTLSGWIECAGIADRTSYDLIAHSGNINVNVKKFIPIKKVYNLVIDKKKYAKIFNIRMKKLCDFIDSQTQEFIVNNMKDNRLVLEFDGVDIECTVESKNVDCVYFIPRVIEPSFGISRILYCLIEQSFKIRDDGRNYFDFKPRFAHIHCVMISNISSDAFNDIMTTLKTCFKKKGIRYKTNNRNCSIGRTYSSFDEIGVPFCITMDKETKSNNTVTLRYRDTTEQIRLDFNIVPNIIYDLIYENITWIELVKKHGLVKQIMESENFT